MNLKAYKLAKNLILSVALIVFSLRLVGEGADPTLVYTGTILLLALFNGIELAEFIDAWREVRTAQAEQSHEGRREDP